MSKPGPLIAAACGALRSDQPVMLVGGGALDRAAVEMAAARAGAVIGADGGANQFTPGAGELNAVIGDMDSVAALERWRADPACHVLQIAEQDSTDLEKCLISLAAPLYLGVGFLGRRFDHTLAATHALLAHAHRRALLIGESDVIFLAPPQLTLSLAVGARVSIFPLRPVRAAASSGLAWPIGGLDLAIGERIGTSNEAVAPEVAMRFEQPGAAVILGREWLDAAIEGLTQAGEGWDSASRV